MKSYFAYIRVSTVKQGEHGCSLIEQKASIEAYAQRHNLTITEWFEERETAAKQGRPEFNRLTGLLKRRMASGVIIHKIDRSARNLKDWAGLGDLLDLGIEVLFAHEGLDMHTRGGRLAADIQAVVAADFIRNLREEVRKGFYGRLKQGFYPLPAPRGYCDNGKAKPKTVDPIIGPLVGEAFKLYATGTYSVDTLRFEMAGRGLLGSSGKPLSPDAMSKLLHNPFYIGLMRIGTTGELFEGNHEPLVRKATFDRVQAILSGRFYPRKQNHTFLFRRLIKCEACGRSLTGERQKGHVYYRCHERSCRGLSLNENAVDAVVAKELSWLKLGGEGLGDLRDLFREEIARERAGQGQVAAGLVRDLGLVDQRLSRLTDAYIDQMIDKLTFEERRGELLHRKQSLKDRLATDENSTFWKTVSERFELGLTAYSDYISGNPDEKHEAVKMFGSNLIANGKTLHFTMRFPFNEIGNWAKSYYGGPYQGAVRTDRPNFIAKEYLQGLMLAIGRHRDHGHDFDGRCDQTSQFKSLKSPSPSSRQRLQQP
jgi:site-specific DNA recombinase